MTVSVIQMLPTVICFGLTAAAQVVTFVFMFISWNRPDSKSSRIGDIIGMVTLVLLFVSTIAMTINLAIALYINTI